jgi:hypothetical protein
MPINHVTVASDPQEPRLGASDWNAAHTNPDIADVTGLQAALDSKAPLANPEFTGTVKFTTQQATNAAGTTFKTNGGSDWLHGGNGGSPNATAYGGWNFDGATANTLASFGASKTLTSLATSTYPSLTEISYVKGATSAIQTQINAKQDTLVSATNIKTVNGSSLLGSGDLAITSAISFAAVEKNLGSVPRLSGRFTVTGLSGLTIGKPVNMFQAAGPYTGKGTRADEAEMDGIIVKAVVTAVDTITAYWNAATRVKGNVKFNYLIGA